MSENKNFWYTGRRMLSYNCLFNFLVGNRGAGKTFWSTEYGIKDFKKTGKQWIYLRRYDTELDGGKKEKYFDAVESKFPNLEFKVKGNVGYIDGEPCCYFCALSKGQTFKSVNFPDVDKIVFDEFILDKKGGNRRYIADEITTFLDFYETVARMRNDVRVFFLANSVSMYNPYFLYFKIFKVPSKGIQRISKEILVEGIANEEYIKAKKSTRFGSIISGTDYEKYSVENNFLRDNKRNMLGKKTSRAFNKFCWLYKGQVFGIWADYTEGKYFVSFDHDPNCPLMFAVTLEDHSENTMITKGTKSESIRHFLVNFKMGNVLFENMIVKNLATDIIRLFL